MNVTREVICDLLPLVEAGEASADTRTLVDDFFRENPEWERAVRGNNSRAAEHGYHLNSDTPDLPSDLEARTLQRTKRLIRVRTWLLGLGIFLSLLPLSSMSSSKTVNGNLTFRQDWQMARDRPDLAILFATAGLCCWAAYFLLRRRLKFTAL